jgi:hypothetical protein
MVRMRAEFVDSVARHGRNLQTFEKCLRIALCVYIIIILLLLQSALQPLVGFRPSQLPLSILSRKVLQSAVASGTSNHQLGGEPGI